MNMKCKAQVLELKKAILTQNLTISEIVRNGGVSRESVLNAQKGKPLTVTTCNKIADALGKPVTELFTVE